MKYKFVKVYRRRESALKNRDKLERQGYKIRLISERLRDSSKQYVLYRSREKQRR